MVEATIEDLAITTDLRGNLTESDGEAVLSTTKIFTGTKPFLKAYIKPFDITEIRMLF